MWKSTVLPSQLCASDHSRCLLELHHWRFSNRGCYSEDVETVEVDLDRLNLPIEVQLPNHCLSDAPSINERISPTPRTSAAESSAEEEFDQEGIDSDSDEDKEDSEIQDNNRQDRICHGGIYSWLPPKCPPSRTFFTYHNLFAHMIVIVGTITGIAVSYTVPPDGIDCRHVGEILIFFAWFLRGLADRGLYHRWPLIEENTQMSENDQLLNKKTRRLNQTQLFWATCVKNFVVTIATMGGIIATLVGVFHRCSCYTNWGRTGLALPEMPDVAETLFHNLKTVHPAITFVSIVIELVMIPLIICIQYSNVLRTFVQRDDNKSNAPWLWKMLKRYRSYKETMRTFSLHFLQYVSGRKRLNRSDTEGGRFGESHELQSVTQEPKSTLTRTDSAEEESVAEGTATPIPNDTETRSSGFNPPSRSGTNILSQTEPHRHNTEREGAWIGDWPLPSRDDV